MDNATLVYTTEDGYIDSPDLFSKEKKQSKMLYDKLRDTRVICPALKQQVFFTLKGWNHIIANKPHKRKGKDLYRRLKLLPLAKDIISNSHTIQNNYIRKGVKYIILEAWIEKVNSKIRIVLVEDKAKKLKFYSIMNKK